MSYSTVAHEAVRGQAAFPAACPLLPVLRYQSASSRSSTGPVLILSRPSGRVVSEERANRRRSRLPPKAVSSLSETQVRFSCVGDPAWGPASPIPSLYPLHTPSAIPLHTPPYPFGHTPQGTFSRERRAVAELSQANPTRGTNDGLIVAPARSRPSLARGSLRMCEIVTHHFATN